MDLVGGATMQRVKAKRVAGLAAMGLAAALLAGCEVETHKSGNGEDVKVATPFGGLRVKTDSADVLSSIGLPAYPGAEMVKKDKDKDNGSADVNMSFGGFQLRVKAMGFRTGDSPEKVVAFYRDGMKRFGDVIECRSERAVGTPVRTTEGLTCDNKHGGHIDVDDHPSKNKIELKAGSEQHQHLVEIETDDGGTKFGLVALDLPGRFFSDSGDDNDKQ
jgi:hypothetical protein